MKTLDDRGDGSSSEVFATQIGDLNWVPGPALSMWALGTLSCSLYLWNYCILKFGTPNQVFEIYGNLDIIIWAYVLSHLCPCARLYLNKHICLSSGEKSTQKGRRQKFPLDRLKSIITLPHSLCDLSYSHLMVNSMHTVIVNLNELWSRLKKKSGKRIRSFTTAPVGTSL